MDRPDALGTEWEALISRSSARGPAATTPWLSTWWRIFGGSDRGLRAVTVRDGESLVGLALLVLRPIRLLGVLPVRRIELLGSGEDEADEICSEYLGVLAERGREAEVADALVSALAEHRPRPHELVFPSMDGDDPMVAALERALSRDGYVVDHTETTKAPFIKLPSTFDAYLAALPSAHRYRVRRSLRDFDRWAEKTAQVHWVTTPAELAEGLSVLQRLHGERWAHQGGVFASPRFRAFHDTVTPQLLERGELQLAWLEAHGRPVAAIYNVVSRGAVSFYQAGRVLDVPRGIRPGYVLHTHAIRRAIELGRTEYDFLGGTSRYKLEFATHTRPIVVLRAARPSLREQAHQLARKAHALASRARRAVYARLNQTSETVQTSAPSEAE